jgi:serine/threonine-protein kinase RsbW
MEMCLVEALNNIVEHAYNSESNNPINIYITIDSDFLTITLVDEGISRTNFEKPTLEFDPNDIKSLPEGGMGLYIIDQLMDVTEYLNKNDHNIFKMTKKLESH